MDLRAQNGVRFLQSKTSLSVMDVLSFKESTHMLLADRVLQDLIAAARASHDTTAVAAANVLDLWDRLMPQARARCCLKRGGAPSSTILTKTWR
jgi:acyl-homoserine-lactone acylase